jgi:hypothetical protein
MSKVSGISDFQDKISECMEEDFLSEDDDDCNIESDEDDKKFGGGKLGREMVRK